MMRTTESHGPWQAWAAERIRPRRTPAFVSEPETNGIAERFMRTLRERVLDGARFRNLAEAREAISAFVERYDREWMLQRHGYRSPEEVRASFSSSKVEAA